MMMTTDTTRLDDYAADDDSDNGVDDDDNYCGDYDHHCDNQGSGPLRWRANKLRRQHE